MSDLIAAPNTPYTLEHFAEEVDVNHPLTARRIPVLRGSHPRWKYHVGLVIGGREYESVENYALEPTDIEVEQLCAYLEKHMRYYNDSYRRQVAARGPFDVDGTVNTHLFRKHPVHGWQYNVGSWTSGVTWYPTPPWSKNRAGEPESPFTLEELLDKNHTYGEDLYKPWAELKAENPDIWERPDGSSMPARAVRLAKEAELDAAVDAIIAVVAAAAE